METWKDIVGYEGYYAISDLGRVKSYSRSIRKGRGFTYTIKEKILKYALVASGYPAVRLYKNGKGILHLIHRLVAKAFLPNPENKPSVNHIDGVKTNSILSNLEWCTNSENGNHASVMGLYQSGDRHYKRRRSQPSVSLIPRQ